MTRAVNVEHFRRGIALRFQYRRSKGQSSFGEWDLNDRLYRELDSHRRCGLSESFWEYLVDELWSWRAIRPKTKQYIKVRGVDRFERLQTAFNDLVPDVSGELPTIEVVEWCDVAPLFEIAQEIKGVDSPTFGSKLCHFLIPPLFVITDGLLVESGSADYQEYWEQCRAAWRCRTDHNELIAEFEKNMPCGQRPLSSYPYATVITELCQHSAL